MKMARKRCLQISASKRESDGNGESGRVKRDQIKFTSHELTTGNVISSLSIVKRDRIAVLTYVSFN